MESPSFQDLGAETISQVHDLSPDTNCDVLTGGLKSIASSEYEDAGIASDDDSLLAQYGALLPSDKLPEKYKRCHRKLVNRSSLPNTWSSIPRGCYRIVDFLHNTAFTKVVIAQSTAKDTDSGREKGKLRCIKIYRLTGHSA